MDKKPKLQIYDDFRAIILNKANESAIYLLVISKNPRASGRQTKYGLGMIDLTRLKTLQNYGNIIYQVSKMNDCNKRGWLEEEDLMLKYLVESSNSKRIKWVEVAKTLHEKLGRARNGKQCRERWQHQVNPNIIHRQWTLDEQENVFLLHSHMGNKWSLIAEHIPERTDNAVKNYFYSTVRRVFTRVNLYLSSKKSQLPFRSMRKFESQFLSKLMAVVDGNFSKKIRLTSEEAPAIAKKILQKVWLLTKDQQTSDQQMEELIIYMNSFRKICKKRKQRSASGSSFDAENSIENSFKSSSQSHPNSAPAQMQEQQDELIEIDFVKNPSKDESEFKTKSTIEDPFIPSSQPFLCKIWSGFKDQGDKWWQVLNKNTENKQQMEQQLDWKWNSNENFMVNNHHEGFLGSSQTYGGSPIVTNLQMLQASIALEDLLLKAKNSSSL